MPAETPFRYFPYRAIVDHRPVRWPGGARLAVWVVPNIEHYRLDIARGGPAPDIRNHSRQEYGNRGGVWRLMDVLAKYGVRGSAALNGEAALYYPRVMEAMLALDWELMGHGVTNSITLTGLKRDEENRVIAETRAAIEQWGSRMRGWLGPGLTESFDSIELLRTNGVDYTCDWVNDDLPYRMNNGLYSIPYSVELNDQPLFNTPSISVDEFHFRIVETFDVLYAEAGGDGGTGRVMCIALHPHLTGAPHRIRALDRALAHIRSHDGVWFATGAEIIDAYRAQE